MLDCRFIVVELDEIDRAILAELQEDASRSAQEIGRRVGLSANPCWRRIRRLEQAGVIQRRVAILDAAKLGKGVTVFVSVRTNRHDERWLEQFARGVEGIAEVVEFYRMSGEVDYLLKVLVADVAEYDRVYHKLIRAAELYDVSSSFAMEQIKLTTAIPIGRSGS
jgi:Lrp/AsnC family transcriptional regulator